MTENKEGGTWLAVSKRGKIGVVLNLSGSQPDREKLGRGFLVADFLKSQTSGTQHLESLKNNSQQYNKFHLIAIEFNEDPVLSHYCNGDAAEKITTIHDGSFAVGNSPLEKPYEKVKRGRARFEEVTSAFGETKNKEKLVDELVALLKWSERHVDPSGAEMSHIPQPYREQYSSVFIDMPGVGYGTRTHTIILVDNNGKTDFYEWTLKEPIQETNREWVASHQEFQVAENS